ncbi:aspartate dehydrogenase domain-containing protein [Rhizobium sp. SG2393]|uniref:aspartate dehydrogenase domain-containing protein n=1 Tax=Rhizobium sp. SG2393 TaxID=3276279 RepID=UPI003672E70D
MIGLIGFGAMARGIHACLPADGIAWRVLRKAEAPGDLPDGLTDAGSLDALIAARPRVIVEAAGQDAVAAYVPAVLAAGIPAVVASVGALADAATFAAVEAARRASGAALILPAGAVGGLDYLAAIAHLPDASILYTARKPPSAFGEELAARGIEVGHDAVTLFEGSPADAARRYPRNLNVAFSIALAARPAPVTVRVIADPAVGGNQHEIEASSGAGTASFRFTNAPSPDNPKTSAVTAMSVAAAIRPFLNRQVAP